MKSTLFLLFLAFILSGCYSGIALGIGTSIGNSGTMGTNVHMGTNEQVNSSIGIGRQL